MYSPWPFMTSKPIFMNTKNLTFMVIFYNHTIPIKFTQELV